MKDLDAIMAERDSKPAPVESTEAETAKPEAQERERDEGGRFAAREQEQEPAAEQEAQPGEAEPVVAKAAEPEEVKPGFVPVQARDAERQKRRAAEQRAAELEKRLQALEQRPAPQAQTGQEPKADLLTRFLTAPEETLEQLVSERLAPITQSQQQQRNFVCRTMAVEKHGEEAIEAAYDAAHEFNSLNPALGPALEARIAQANNPFDELVKWHREQGALQKYGADPEAYINAEIERRLAESAQQQPAAQTPSGQMPSSFAAARSGAPRGGAQATGGPRPLSEIMGGR